MTSTEEHDKIANNDYGSADETAKLLSEVSSKIPKASSFNGPSVTNTQTNSQTTTSSSTPSKPVLIRQDRTSTYLASPQLSGTGANLGGSEESEDPRGEDNPLQKSAPDVLIHQHSTPKISISNSNGGENMQLVPVVPTTRCRTCRRSSTSPTSIIHLDRSASKDSGWANTKDTNHGYLRPHLFVHHHSSALPPVLITGSPTHNSRIIRQSSQPEASTLCGAHCTHAPQASSLRQLKETNDGISGIACDALRISGAMRPFKQGVLLCPQTLSQSRRKRLRRAFTDATSDTLTYVRT
ncbi:unnamed protein product, partial [Diamesa tonsa]